MQGTSRTALTARSFFVTRVVRVSAVGGFVAFGALAGCGGASEPTPSVPSTSPSTGKTAPVEQGASPPATQPVSETPPSAPGMVPATAWPFGPSITPDERAAQVERLKKDPGPIRSNWTPPGRDGRYGHAEALVAAPLDAVRARLADFAHYKDLAGPKFKKVNVVDKQGDATDVYFQLPIMKGLVTIWYVTRFRPPRSVDGRGDVIEGTFVKGNIKGMHIAFTVRPLDDKNTVVDCDLLLSLNIPAPQANVDEELRDACGDALNAVRARSIAGAPAP